MSVSDKHNSGLPLFVHAVDTEGPLHESLDATFTRYVACFKASG